MTKKKVNERPSWDEYFLNICDAVSQRSHDENTKVGAVIVDERKRIVSTGYNGFPAGIDDSFWPKNREDVYEIDLNGKKEQITKYEIVTHAEANAIASSRTALVGCTLYVNLFPCNECAKLIITAGIKRVVYSSMRDEKIFNISKKLMEQAGIELVEISK